MRERKTNHNQQQQKTGKAPFTIADIFRILQWRRFEGTAPAIFQIGRSHEVCGVNPSSGAQGPAREA